MSESVQIQIRDAKPEDIPFIFSSWLKSFRVSAFAKAVPNSLYFEGQHRLISQLLERSNVLIAANLEDPDQIMGWICVDRQGHIPVFHYIYVKQTFRRLGIGRKLFDAILEGPFVYTHETGLVEKLSNHGVYSPYALYEVKK